MYFLELEIALRAGASCVHSGSPLPSSQLRLAQIGHPAGESSQAPFPIDRCHARYHFLSFAYALSSRDDLTPAARDQLPGLPPNCGRTAGFLRETPNFQNMKRRSRLLSRSRQYLSSAALLPSNVSGIGMPKRISPFTSLIYSHFSLDAIRASRH